MIHGKYFPAEELTCRHCGANGVKQALVDKLDQLRELAGFPLPLTSAYRCPNHPRELAKESTSGAHTAGLAADIHVFGPKAFIVLRIAFSLGFSGIGIKMHGPAAGRFIHLDLADANGEQPRPTIWGYP